MVMNVTDSCDVILDHKRVAISLYSTTSHSRRENIRTFTTPVDLSRLLVFGTSLASHALGNYPFQDCNLVTADPDILIFDFRDHKSQFIVLASNKQ